jgi:cholera toxin transcriptional activator
MPPQDPQARIRFESFELDLQTRELRKDGRPIKLQDQPVKLLVLLASRAGELVTRAEIEKALWGDGEFVEFEHAINTAMRKVREALGDDLETPRFIETLPRKGYRFIAAVENAIVMRPQSGSEDAMRPTRGLREKIPLRSGSADTGTADHVPVADAALADAVSGSTASQTVPRAATVSAAADTEFSLPRPIARLLFLTTQAGYLAMYCAALYNEEAVEEVLSRVFAAPAAIAAPFVIVAAMCGIAVRLYLISSIGLEHPAAGEKFARLFPALFVLDVLWAVSPLLLVRKIGYGLALGAIAALTYLPFSQRILVQSIYPRSKPANSNGS